MRVIVNIICLLMFLLGGEHLLHADTHHTGICNSPSWDFVKKQQVKVKTAELGCVLIEDADADSDEEFHSGDDLNKGNANKILSVSHSFVNNWYLAFSDTFLFKDCAKQFEIFTPNSRHSNPIYLTVGVLRI